MSSQTVRSAITSAVETAAAPYPVFDLSDYVTSEEALKDQSGITVLVQYVTADNALQNIAGENNQGWREDGSVVIHIVVPTGFESQPIVEFGDTLIQAINGQRLDPNLTVESMTPFSDFSNGATQIRGGTWKGWASNIFYVRRDCY